MADYNIYIHNVNGFNAPVNPVKAWQSEENGGSQTKAWVTSGSSESGDGNKNNPPQFNVANAISSVAKSHPVLAAALAVVVITDKIITTVEPFVSRDTGDYRFGVWYSNAKNAVVSVLKPISSTVQQLRMQQETYHLNKTAKYERLLLGDVFYNSNTTRRI